MGDEPRSTRRRDAPRQADFWQLHNWAKKAPDEVPVLNGEFEFISAHASEVADRKDNNN